MNPISSVTFNRQKDLSFGTKIPSKSKSWIVKTLFALPIVIATAPSCARLSARAYEHVGSKAAETSARMARSLERNLLGNLP